MISHASWQAHTLNLVSMNNVGLTQMFATFMITEAFTETWIDAMKKINQRIRVTNTARSLCEVEVECLALNAIPIIGPGLYRKCVNGCQAPWNMHRGFMQTMKAYLVSIEAVYGPITHGLPTSYRLLGAYSAMNQSLVDSFARRTEPILDEVHATNRDGRREIFFVGLGSTQPIAQGY